MPYYVYILASKRNGTLYTGMTNDLVRRIFEHRESFAPGFTKRYHVKSLVYFEIIDEPESAIRREKQIKAWHRKWKIKLIEQSNPYWNVLYDSLA